MNTARLPQRKRTRLPVQLYAQCGPVCSVTLAVRDRRPVFADPRAATSAVDLLLNHSQKTQVPIYGYCVMPDHVHLVLGASKTCDVITFVGQFKNLAQRAVWRLGINGPFWQSGFYDHFLRQDEQLERVIEYVLDNPVRAGLVTTRNDYPFSGTAGDKPPPYSDPSALPP